MYSLPAVARCASNAIRANYPDRVHALNDLNRVAVLAPFLNKASTMGSIGSRIDTNQLVSGILNRNTTANTYRTLLGPMIK